MYGVATPANYVAGGGKYLTSDTDKVIVATVARFIKILTPNIHIPLQNSDGNGHSFSDVYLKYKGDRIISDIKSSLNQLKENDEQESQESCISPPELTTLHKITGVALASADFLVNNTKNAVVYAGNGIYNTGLATKNIFKGLLANVVDSLPSASSVTTILPSISESSNTDTETTSPNTDEQTQTTTEDITTNETKTDETATTVTETPPDINAEPVEVLPPQAPQVPEIIPDVSHSGGGGDSITEDKTAPVITITGTNPVNVTKNTLYTDAGATALDDIDGVRDVVTTGTIDISVVGAYTITYTATDLSNNTATATRTVNVTEIIIPDTTAPVISVVGTNPINVTQNNNYTDEGATALDDIDGVRDVVVSGAVDTSVVGIYTITYTATDLSNNTATATRTVNVVAPPLPPEIDTIIDKDTTLTSGEYNYDNLIINNNAILTLEGNPESANTFKGVKITAKNITINNGSRISADLKGYKNTGPGAPDVSHAGAGASYGGVGYGNTSTSVYGSATMPLELGSAGGGPNAFAGGAIRLIITKTFTNNGMISANGDISSSGGSIYVTAKEITGSGTFSANGGNLYAGGFFAGPGGGGRIAFYYETFSFTGKTEALGGCGRYDGMTLSCAKNGTIGLFDTINNDLYLNSSWQFRESDGPFSFNNIFVSNGANVTSEKSVSINADEILIDKASQFTLAEDQTINIPIISLDNSTLTLSGSETITSDVLTMSGSSNVTIGEEKILSLEIPNITVGSGSLISVNTKGYVDGLGAPLAPNYYAGASYGGVGGGNIPTSVYGSDIEPIDFGSGGTGIYRGGGAIRLIVSNTLTNNGTISANGDVTSSGGSLYINTKNILGNGNFYANGGGAYCGGSCYQPGGGGRVALYYETYSFTGKVLADGWSGSIGTSSAGTVKKIDTTLSILKAITVFNFAGLTPSVIGVVNETEKTISLTVPFGTVVSALVPTITISEKATISPDTNIAQDFTNPVTYIVTAENGFTQNYIVTVTVDSDPNKDITPPVISALALSPSPIFGYAKIGDTITLSITADSAGYTAQTININNVAATNFTDKGNGAYTAIYIVSSLNNDVTSGTIPVIVVLTDAAGNSNEAYTTVTANALQIDAHAPTLVSAKVMTATSIDVTFSEDIDGNTLNTSGNEFTVSGHTVTEASELKGVITLTLSTNIGAGETPSVTFESVNFKDLAGNQVVNPITVTATNSI
ncbi:MAG: immunoglobulin-like domain-containing protein [Candidatus Paceibacterota bacterium]